MAELNLLSSTLSKGLLYKDHRIRVPSIDDFLSNISETRSSKILTFGTTVVRLNHFIDRSSRSEMNF